MPRALFGDGILADARVWFALVTALGVLAVIRAGRVPVAGWLVAGNPVVGLTVATGGHDLAMAGLLVAGLAAAARPGPRAAALAGLLVGLAAATKPTAWPVLAVLVVLLARQRRAGPGVAAAAVPVVVLLAPALVTPQRLAEHVLTFPAGLAAVPSPAGSPLPGGWLAALPAGGGWRSRCSRPRRWPCSPGSSPVPRRTWRARPGSPRRRSPSRRCSPRPRAWAGSSYPPCWPGWR